MTNKEFRDILARYPDDYTIQLDNAFGWETPSNKNKVDPHLYVNTDFGFIEIEPPEVRDIWVTPEEGLPTDFTPCLFLRKFYIEDNVWDYTTELGSYEPKRGFRVWDYYNDCEELIKPKDVAAWMPIPRFDRDRD